MQQKKGTGSTKRVMNKEAREASRAHRWADRQAPKVEKKIARVEKKLNSASSTPEDRARIRNQNVLANAKAKRDYVADVAATNTRAGHSRMDAIAGRNSKGKLTSNDNKVTFGRVARQTIEERRADSKARNTVAKKRVQAKRRAKLF